MHNTENYNRIIFLGDITGRQGRTAVKSYISGLFEYVYGTVQNIYVDGTLAGGSYEGSLLGYFGSGHKLTYSTLIFRGDGDFYGLRVLQDDTGTHTRSVIYTSRSAATILGTSYVERWHGTIKSLSEIPE